MGKLIERFSESKIKRYWYKYLRLYEESQVTTYLAMLEGGKKVHQRKAFVTNNYYYHAAHYLGTGCTSQSITMRGYTPSSWAGVEPASQVTVMLYNKGYIVVQVGNIYKQVKADKGTYYTITFSDSGDMNDTVINVHGANLVQELGDISCLYVGRTDFSAATRLRSIQIGSTEDGYSNPNLTEVSFGTNAMLEYLYIQNCPNVAQSLDLSGCQALRELDIRGSGFTGVTFALGGLIELAYLCSPAALNMRSLYNLTDDYFSLESYDNMTSLRLEDCDGIDSLALVQACANLARVRIIGIDWELGSTDLLNEMLILLGLDENNYNTDVSVLSGTVYVSGTIRNQELVNYAAAWENLEVTYDSANLVTQYLVTYVNADGTELYSTYIDRGSTPIDPVELGYIDTPTQDSTAQYDYTYAGWDDITSVVLADTTVTATYTETVREYTVTWYSRAGVSLGSTTVEYGAEAVYDGDIPTRTDGESTYVYYLFTGWDKSTGFVTGDMSVYAVWESAGLPATGTSISDMTATEIYGITQVNGNVSSSSSSNIMGNYAETKDRIQITVGHDFDFDNVTSYTLVDVGSDAVFDGTEDNVKEYSYTLFEEDSPAFTLCIDYEFTGTESDTTLLSCYDYDGSEGFRLRYNSGANLQWGSSSVTVSNTTYRNVLVLRHPQGSNYLYWYTFNGTGTVFLNEPTNGVLTRTRSTTTSQPIILGAIKYSDAGTYDMFGSGVIHFCKIWMDDLGVSVAQELAYWYHEIWTFEYCDSGRYRLASSSSKYTNASFILAHELYLTHNMNSSNDNTGGWDACLMRQFLNPTYDLYDENHATTYDGYGRVYKALPYEWQSIIKQVRIPANGGYYDTSIKTSYDYLYLASYVELSNTSSTTYVDEGSYISWFTSDSYRAKFRGRLVPEDATYYLQTDEPTSLGSTCKSGDVWKYTSSTVYIFVDDDEIAKYNLTTSSTPFSLAYTANGGGWLTAYNWWLRSARIDNSTHFWGVSTYGSLYSYYASNALGVVFGFSI